MRGSNQTKCLIVLLADPVASILFADALRLHSASRSPGDGVGDNVFLIGVRPAECRQVNDALSSEPVIVTNYDNAELFLQQINEDASGCVLVPCDLAGMGVRALIREVLQRHLPLAVVVIGRKPDLATAVELVRRGATDFLEQPLSNRQIRSIVRRTIGIGG
jgi:DNA-binding NtrC family response regulator